MSENIEMAAKLKVLHNSLEEMTKRLQVSKINNKYYMKNNSKQKKIKAEQAINKDLMGAKNCTEVNKALPTCDAIRLWGYTKSGYMMIDPDGEGINLPLW